MSEAESSASRQAGRIKDARGRSVTQLDPVAMYLLGQHEVIEADVLRAIAHQKGVRITGKERASLASRGGRAPGRLTAGRPRVMLA